MTRAAEPVRCTACGEVIGVYEPVVVRIDAVARETSIAAEPMLPIQGAEHYHAACFEGPLAAAEDIPAEVVPISRPSERTERSPRSAARRSGTRRLTG